ncbi:MAG: YoaK family protein [Novosphingobium sp.]|uniref:YoaK family protein n=1 Tax=Novosphingobium sp. TaxID=1874826 RepID=UPI0027377307|nr:YoaK family protein [Novosphingobium sp.]MDP3552002.1 YoaK family protein [Novosphingobium sp.]
MIQYDRPRRLFAIALAAMAGFIDAVGFLSADGYFVSFMSGNSTRLGVSLGTDPARAAMPAVLIAGFLGGVTLGALLSRWAGTLRKPVVLAFVALMLVAAASGRVLGLPVLMLGGMVMAMGALNNTFQRGGEVSVGLTYMTGALVKLGQGLANALTGQPNSGWTSWASLWGGLLAGAVLGAFLQDRLPMGCLWLAAAYCVGMVAVAFRLPSDVSLGES